MDAGRKLVVGVNAFTEDTGLSIPTLEIDHTIETRQKQNLAQLKATRDQDAAQRALDEVRRSAQAGENVMPALLEAARCDASVGETVNALGDVLGRYRGANG